MQIQITGRHLEATDAIKDYISEKMQKLERHFDHITDIHVILSPKNSHTKAAEAKVNLAKGQLFAESESKDMYAAVDTLLDKLDKQLLKHKNKMQNHHAHPSKFDNHKDMAANEQAVEDAPFADGELE